MTYKNGNVYEGEMRNDERNGDGTMTYNNGDIYEGNWDYNKMHGKGKMTYKTTGDVYDGDWLNDKKNGMLKKTSNNIETYGYYIEDKIVTKNDYETQSRPGRRIYDNGIYDGTFMNNEPHGKGEMKYTNGNRYDGNFENNKPNGYGIMYYENGDITGYWKDGTIIKREYKMQSNNAGYDPRWRPTG